MNRRDLIGRASMALVALGIPARLFGQPSENAENTQIWTTREGIRVRIVDMTDEHLRNCILYLERRAGELNVSVDPWGANPFRPRPASQRWPKYDIMRREANRRKLPWI